MVYEHYSYVVYIRLRGHSSVYFFFFNDTATTEIYTLSLHDALPISSPAGASKFLLTEQSQIFWIFRAVAKIDQAVLRSEEHTSELQSRQYLVCRLLLEKKKKNTTVCLCYFLIITILYPSTTTILYSS